MTIFFFLSLPENLAWLQKNYDHYMGPSQSNQDVINGIPEADILVPANYDWIELRQVPHGAVFTNLQDLPVIGRCYRTGDDDADFQRLVQLLREARPNAANVTFTDPSG